MSSKIEKLDTLRLHIANWDSTIVDGKNKKIQPIFYARRDDDLQQLVRIQITGFEPHFYISCLSKTCSFDAKLMNLENQMIIRTILEKSLPFYLKKEDICFEQEEEAVVQRTNFWGYQVADQYFFHFKFRSLATYQYLLRLLDDLAVLHNLTTTQLFSIIEETEEYYDRKTNKLDPDALEILSKSHDLNKNAIRWLWDINYAQLNLCFAHIELFNVTEPILQLNHERQLNIAGCVDLKNVTYKRMHDDNYPDICKVRFQDIHPCPPDDTKKAVPVWSELSFDIEVYSNQEDTFPVASIDENCITQISMIMRSGDSISNYLLTYKAPHHQYKTMVGQLQDCSVLEYYSEADILFGFRDLIIKLNPDWMEGYNIDGFDWRYIFDRAERLGILNEFAQFSRKKGHVCQMHTKVLSSKAYGDNKYDYVEIPGRSCVDVMSWLQKEFKLETYALADVGHEIVNETKHDVTAKEMFRAFKSGDLKNLIRVAHYCVQDSLLVNKIVCKTNLLNRMIEMANINFSTFTHLLYRGQSTKALSNISSRTVLTHCIPYRIKGTKQSFRGGKVLEPKAGYYKDPTSILDFTGLYPSIIMEHNICFTTYVEDPYLIDQLQKLQKEHPDYKSMDTEPLDKLRSVDIPFMNGVFRIFEWKSDVFCRMEDDGVTIMTEHMSLEAAIKENEDMNKAQIMAAMKKNKFRWFTKCYWCAVDQAKRGVLPQIQMDLKKRRTQVKRSMAEIEHSDKPEDKIRYTTLDGTQLAIKVTMNCMPSHNHEILTERGFFTLKQMLHYFKTHGPDSTLKIACYVPNTKSLIYADITEDKVLQSKGTHEILTFGDMNNTGGVSVDVTGNHRMYVKCMDSKIDSKTVDYQITNAEQVKQTLEPHGDAAILQFQAHCESGYLDGNSFCDNVAQFLDLNEWIEKYSFLQLYGYWLAGGYLDKGKRAVSFLSVKEEDDIYLKRLIYALPKRVRDSTIIVDTPATENSNVSKRPHYFHITDSAFWSFFSQNYASYIQNAEDMEDVKAKKSFMPWCLQLNSISTNFLLRGLIVADGGGEMKSRGHMCISTSSESFADQISQLGMHAGYSTLKRINAHHSKIEGVTSWVVCFSKLSEESEPKLMNMTTDKLIQQSSYEGTVWCVNVPIAPNLIIVRKFNQIDNIKHTSRPIVISNSLYGFTAAPRLCMKALSSLTTTIGRDLLLKSKYYMENLFTVSAQRNLWTRADRMAYMTADGKSFEWDITNTNGSPLPEGAYPVHPTAKENEPWVTAKFQVKVIAGDTDSIFCHFPDLSLADAISIGPKAGEMISKYLNSQHIKMCYEKTFFPLLIEGKKRYMGCKYTVPLTSFKVDMTGLAMKRRNYAPITRDNLWRLYHHVMQVVPDEHKKNKFIKQPRDTTILQELQALAENFVHHALEHPLAYFAISACLKNEYKNNNLPHVSLAKRMEERDAASRPKAGQRFKYIFIRDETRSQELCEKSETLDYAERHNLEPDLEYYLVQQLTNPIITLMSVMGKKLEAQIILQETLDKIHQRYKTKLLKRGEESKRKFFSTHTDEGGKCSDTIILPQKKKVILKKKRTDIDPKQAKITSFLT